MKVQVTGSHGFLGSHLVNLLEKEGYEVVRGDRKGTVPRGIDWIFDLASYGNLYGQEGEEEIIEANYTRVEKLLENARKQKCKAIVLTSSSSIYLLAETTYSWAKRHARWLGVRERYEKNGLPTAVVIPFTVYGIGDNPKHLIPRIFRSCLKGESLELAPLPTHDYVWVGDLVEDYLYIARNIAHLKWNSFEIGTGKPTTNYEVLRRIEAITGKRANLKGYIEARPYDVPNWYSTFPFRQDYTTLGEGLRGIYAEQRPQKQ